MFISKRFAYTLTAIVIGALFCSTASAALSDFETGIYWSTSNYDLYWAFYDPFATSTAPAGETYPLLIYLHGSGNSGRNISGPASHPNASMLVNNAKQSETRAFVLIPQTHSSWSATGTAVLALRELIADFAAAHPIDLNRVYITGFSLGGLGVFSFESAYPTEIAAGVPMAGALWETDTVTKATNRGTVATWAFSGNIDGTVPPEDCEEALTRQRYYGGNPMFTIFSSTGHNDTWQRVNELDQNGLISWLFAQYNGQPQDDSMFVGWPINETETLVLDGPGESINNDLDYFAGYYGRGDLGITNGAVVTSRKGYVAAQAGSRGNTIIDGTNSAWNCSGTMTVGDNNGVGSLHVANGATLSSTYLLVNEYSYLSGNGDFDVDELVSVGTINPGDIATVVEASGTLTYGGRYVDPLPVSGVAALETLDEDIYLDALEASGTDVTGVMNFSGKIRINSDSNTYIQLDGTGAGEFDAIVAQGTAYVAGDLYLSLVDDYKPENGDEFVIVSASTVTGTFSPLHGVYPPNGTELSVVYGSDYVKVVARVRGPGDCNGDDRVNLTDFIILKQNYGSTDAVWAEGDFNGDGIVNLDDFIILKQNYGM